MVNWETGKSNARFWVLCLLEDNFGPGDKIVDSSFGTSGCLCSTWGNPGSVRFAILRGVTKGTAAALVGSRRSGGRAEPSKPFSRLTGKKSGNHLRYDLDLGYPKPTYLEKVATRLKETDQGINREFRGSKL